MNTTTTNAAPKACPHCGQPMVASVPAADDPATVVLKLPPKRVFDVELEITEVHAPTWRDREKLL